MNIKFNGGNLALLCEKCGVICATGDRIPMQYRLDHNHGELVFCSEKCRDEYLEKIKRRCVIVKEC